MVELKVNRPQHVPGDVGVRPANPSIRKPQTDHSGPSFSRILASIAAPARAGVGHLPGKIASQGVGHAAPPAWHDSIVTPDPHDNIIISDAARILNVPHLEPVPNGCSVTSLLMVLDYYGIQPGSLDQYSQLVAPSPDQLHELAEQFQGVTAELVYNGNINDMVALIDANTPPIIFGAEDANGFTPISAGGSGHCVVVCGYDKDPLTGQVTTVYLNDPNVYDRTLAHQVDREMSYDEFMAFWSAGSDNEYMVLTFNPPPGVSGGVIVGVAVGVAVGVGST